MDGDIWVLCVLERGCFFRGRFIGLVELKVGKMPPEWTIGYYKVTLLGLFMAPKSNICQTGLSFFVCALLLLIIYDF